MRACVRERSVAGSSSAQALLDAVKHSEEIVPAWARWLPHPTPAKRKRKTQKEKAKGSEGRLEAEAAARTGAARPPESSVAPAASGAPRRCGAALPGAGGQGRGRGGTAEGKWRRAERTERGKSAYGGEEKLSAGARGRRNAKQT